MYKMKWKPTLKEQKIKYLVSYAISNRIRDRRKIMDEDIEIYHITEPTARDDAKAVVRELKKHDAFWNMVDKGLKLLQ